MSLQNVRPAIFRLSGFKKKNGRAITNTAAGQGCQSRSLDRGNRERLLDVVLFLIRAKAKAVTVHLQRQVGFQAKSLVAPRRFLDVWNVSRKTKGFFYALDEGRSKVRMQAYAIKTHPFPPVFTAMALDRQTEDSRLSAISTNWEEIIETRGDSAGEQRNRVLIRYSSCVYKYILQASKNADIADDLSQEFALRFVRGDYAKADPAKGRFRDYLRASLRNLITDHFRKNRELALSVSAAERLPDVQVDLELANLDLEFQQNWRQHVLSLAWEALRESDAGRTNDYYAVLRFRSLNADMSSAEMAKQLSIQLNKPVTAEWVRQKLSRGRQKFARLLTMEVRQSINAQTEDAVREELVTLGLSKYLDQ